MYPAKSGLVIGFHGCDAALVKKLISGKTTLRNSRNSYDWLGSGIYFWENNQQRALEFANELKNTKRSKMKSPAVVGAVLDLSNIMPSNSGQSKCWSINGSIIA